MKFYTMYARRNVEGYPILSGAIDDFNKACEQSAWQFLDRKEVEVPLVYEEYELKFPDCVRAGRSGCIYLIRDKVRRVMDERGVDNLFYKKVSLVDDEMGIREPYWLMVPPKINCLDFSNLDDYETEDIDLPPWQLMCTAKKIKIIDANVGDYKIFKLAGVTNQDIIVTESLKNALGKEHFENLCFCEL